MATKVQKVMVEPITLIFKYLQTKTPVQIWLYDHPETKLEGIIVGFDEFMNVVLINAVEVNSKRDSRKEIGKILLKGENITLIGAISNPTQ